jgi:hypothetical protein
MLAEAHLFEVVRAIRPTGCFAGCLHGRQQEADEHADDGDHHQEFDERKAPSLGKRGRSHEYTFLMPKRAGNEKMNKSSEKNWQKPMRRFSRNVAVNPAAVLC